MMTFTLPKLPYAYDALAPHIDALTMEIHHTKHHQSYVDKLNKYLQKIESESLPSSLISLLKKGWAINPLVRNNAGGHFNHSFLWESMTPAERKAPSKKLSQAIESEFGSLEKMLHRFSDKAKMLFGSGWSWLCVDIDNKLHLMNTANQDNPWMLYAHTKYTPLLGLDVWEHAYYLSYQNRRPAYIEAFWNVVNWEIISKRYEEAIST